MPSSKSAHSGTSISPEPIGVRIQNETRGDGARERGARARTFGDVKGRNNLARDRQWSRARRRGELCAHERPGEAELGSRARMRACDVGARVGIPCGSVQS